MVKSKTYRRWGMSEDTYPSCITALPRVKVGFPGVNGWLSQGPDSQVVFFEIKAGSVVPPHSHGEQFGIVIEGEMSLTIGGMTKVYAKGDSYHIPNEVEHQAETKTYVRVMDFFADVDRYSTD